MDPSFVDESESQSSPHINGQEHIGDMSSKDLTVEHLAAGANRQTAVADWSRTGLLAYGADCNIALWRPAVSFIEFTMISCFHIQCLLLFQGACL